MRIVVMGACGRIGSEVCRLLQAGWDGCTLAGAVDVRAAPGSGVLRELGRLQAPADAAVDFSHHSAAPTLCAWAVQRRLPLVIAATGHTDAERACIRRAARQIPVFWAANLSLGVALASRLAQTAAAALPQADIEIVEAHHSRKQGAPSATARQLAAAICRARPEYRPRQGAARRLARAPQPLAIHALRLGETAGTHAVLFGGAGETLAIVHTVHTPQLYAKGALQAARFVAAQPAGIYDMQQLLRLQLRQKAGGAAHAKKEDAS